MTKFRIFADFSEEERFLDGMAREGFRLVKHNTLGIYKFRRSEPHSRSHRVDYRMFKSNAELEGYLTLFRDAGWEHVCGTRRSGSQYFLPIPNEARTDGIFSDDESRAELYKRFAAQCAVSMMSALMFFAAVHLSNPRGWNLLDVKSWYFTKGLWEMSGSLFWKAFLFETPFAALRVVPVIALVALAALYGWMALKANARYKRR